MASTIHPEFRAPHQPPLLRSHPRIAVAHAILKLCISSFDMFFPSISTMSRRRLTTPDRVAIAATAEFLTPRSSAKKFNCSKSSYYDLKKRWENGSPLRTKKPPGRPPMLPAPLWPKLATLAVRNRRLPLHQLAKKVKPVCGTTMCVNSLRKYLAKTDNKRRRAKRKPLLPPRIKILRRRWIKETVGVNWDAVAFTDEASVALTQGGAVWVTCKQSERFLDACLAPAIRKSSQLMLWGAVWKGGRSNLVRLKREDEEEKGGRKSKKSKKKRGITAQVLIDSVYTTELNRVWKSLCRRWRGYGVQPYIVEDNSRLHTAKKTRKVVKKLGFKMLFHPPNSPDLNAIEHVWAALKRRLSKIEDLPTNKDALWEVVQREWKAIPQKDIDNIIDSMPRRRRAVRSNMGGATKW